MIAYIYGDKISSRSGAATFSHLVEVCGMLTIHDREKKREGLDVTDALCKTLGWYFPLLAKFKIKSVEALVFRKFPLVCPYCRKAPHDEIECKQVKGTAPTVNHEELARLARENWSSRPKSLDEWQQMFQRIYPRLLTDTKGRSTVGLLEELGELAEAVRVGDAHPKYFLGEAADTFSYVMGIANEHAIRIKLQSGQTFSFQDEFLRRYPGLCTQCGYKVCACPSIPEATIGRMAKELGISSAEEPFIADPQSFAEEGKHVAREVLELQGGYNGLTAQLPLDRGDTNHSLVLLCNAIADAVEGQNPDLAASLRAEAFKVGSKARPPGTRREALDMSSLLKSITDGWTKLNASQKHEIKAEGELIGDLGAILDTRRLLFVFSNPTNSKRLLLANELRTVMRTIKNGEVNIAVRDLPAATADDLRTELLHSQVAYDVVHFSGHANADELIFEDEKNRSHPVSLQVVAEMLKQYKVKCVILNACETLQNMTTAIAPYTIGMEDDIYDESATAFSRGFYDALSAGKNYDEAYQEGVTAVKLKGHSADMIKLLKT